MAERVHEGVWRLDLASVNAYLIEDDVLTLADAGLPWHDSQFQSEIRGAGFEPSDVERVLITHFDLDHVGVLASLPGDQRILAGEPDRAFVAGQTKPGFGNLKAVTQQLTTLLLTPPASPPQTIKDGESIGSFTAIHTPGHTPGHMAYVSDVLDLAIIGDLLRSDGSELSPPPWFLNQNSTAIEWSLERLIDRMPPVDCVAPGHGDPICEDGYRALERAHSREARGSGP